MDDDAHTTESAVAAAAAAAAAAVSAETVPANETVAASPTAMSASTSAAPADDDLDGSAAASASGALPSLEALPEPEMITFSVVFGKTTHNISFDAEATVARLKERLQGLTNVPPNMQKLMLKGMIKDDQASLKQVGVKTGAKLMLVGSTVSDVVAAKAAPALAANVPMSLSMLADFGGGTPLSDLPEHKKVLDKGRPEDGEVGYRNKRASVPNNFALRGLLNRNGHKVRLTFKHDVEQLWIGTNERTEKVPYSSIRNIGSEPIKDNEDYHIMSFQLGPTEKSRYFVYFVPAQYTQAIKNAIMNGGFMF